MDGEILTMKPEKLIFLLITLPEGRARARYEAIVKERLAREQPRGENNGPQDEVEFVRSTDLGLTCGLVRGS